MSAKGIKDSVWNAIADNEAMRGKSASYLANLRYRLRRKAVGYCLTSGCQEKPEKAYCERHGKMQAESHKKYIERLKGVSSEQAK